MTYTLSLVVVLLAIIGQATAQTLPDTKSGEHEVRLDELRKSMASEFAGRSAFDDTLELTIGDQLPEVTVQQACRSNAEVLRAVRDTMSKLELSQVGTSRQFPQNGVSFIRSYPVDPRNSEGPKAKDLVLLYFAVHKGGGLDCEFTFGAFSRTTIEKASEAAKSKRDEFYNRLVSGIEASISEIEAELAKPRQGALFKKPDQRPPPIEDADRVLGLIRSAAIYDRIFSKAAANAKIAIQTSLSAYPVDTTDFEVIVTDFTSIKDPSIEPYRWPNCVAIPYDFRTPIILCDAAFLAEMEVVLRYYEHGESLQTTEAIKGLVKLLSTALRIVLERVRSDPRLMALSGEDDRHIVDHMSMLLLFLLSHEVGHLISGSEMGALNEAALNKSSDYGSSILRLCKQADQFIGSDVVLDFYDLSPSTVQRSIANRFRLQDKLIDVVDQKFREEEVADEFSIDLTLKYFGHLSASESELSDYMLYLYTENLQAVAIYTWYKSFLAFQRYTCGKELSNAGELSICLLRDANNFVTAADVFGRYHSNILIRVLGMLSALVAERTTFYDIPMPNRVVAVTAADLASFPAARRGHILRVLGVIERFLFLKRLVDTPVKFAFQGCAMAWINEVRSKPPNIYMTFYPFEYELSTFMRDMSQSPHPNPTPHPRARRP